MTGWIAKSPPPCVLVVVICASGCSKDQFCRTECICQILSRYPSELSPLPQRKNMFIEQWMSRSSLPKQALVLGLFPVGVRQFARDASW